MFFKRIFGIEVCTLFKACHKYEEWDRITEHIYWTLTNSPGKDYFGKGRYQQENMQTKMRKAWYCTIG